MTDVFFSFRFLSLSEVLQDTLIDNQYMNSFVCLFIHVRVWKNAMDMDEQMQMIIAHIITEPEITPQGPGTQGRT